MTAILVLTIKSALALSEPIAEQDSASFDADRTAHIARVVPMPTTLSPEAQQWIASPARDQPGNETLEVRRAGTDAWPVRDSAEALEHYPVAITESEIAGVKTDSGSRIEGDPIANLAKTRVVSIYYRLAPEHPFPAAVDDVVAVYKALLKTFRPGNIGIYGASADAIPTCEVAVKLKQLGMPLPGALGVFSGSGDFSRVADSRQLLANDGFPGNLNPTDANHLPDNAYVGATNRRDPLLSPLYADLRALPATLLVSATRDALLGDIAMLQRALMHAGVDARLVVIEALPHAFWYHFDFQETQEALTLMAQFLDQKVGH